MTPAKPRHLYIDTGDIITGETLTTSGGTRNIAPMGAIPNRAARRKAYSKHRIRMRRARMTLVATAAAKIEDVAQA